jgi:hypothetical protein
MRVTKVFAAVRFSKDITAAATLATERSHGRTWSEWPGEGRSDFCRLGHSRKSLPSPKAHYCQEHQTVFKRFEKDGKHWYSHPIKGGGWCKEQPLLRGWRDD